MIEIISYISVLTSGAREMIEIITYIAVFVCGAITGALAHKRMENQ